MAWSPLDESTDSSQSAAVHIGYHDAIHVQQNLVAPYLFSGTGSPEAAVTAPVGALFFRSDGGAGTVLYSKETGAGNTGWVAISASTWTYA